MHSVKNKQQVLKNKNEWAKIFTECRCIVRALHEMSSPKAKINKQRSSLK